MTGKRQSQAGFKLPGLAPRELEEAIAAEKRPHVRDRLRVLRLVLGGVAPRDAAATVGCDPATARRWVQKAQRCGWRVLTRDGRANARPSRRKERAATAAPSLPKPSRAPSVVADAKQLRTLAAREADRRMAKRLRVIALLAEGLGTLDVAARERTNDTTVRQWRTWYLKGGIDGLRRVSPGPRLGPRELAELGRILKASPVISLDHLRSIVRERFGIEYTTGGLDNLLRSQFPRVLRTT